MYRALIENASFRRAFVACDDAYAALLTSAAELVPSVHAFTDSRGVNGAQFSVRDPGYRALLRYLESAPYREIVDQLRQGT